MSCFRRSSTATAFNSGSETFCRSIARYYRERAEAALSVLDSHLAHRDYVYAAEPTIADLICYADVAFAEVCGFDLKRWSNVALWAERVTALPDFQAPFALLAMEDAELT